MTFWCIFYRFSFSTWSCRFFFYTASINDDGQPVPYIFFRWGMGQGGEAKRGEGAPALCLFGAVDLAWKSMLGPTMVHFSKTINHLWVLELLALPSWAGTTASVRLSACLSANSENWRQGPQVQWKLVKPILAKKRHNDGSSLPICTG